MTMRRGSVFIMALAILSIMTVAAYGFLAAAQAGHETSAALNHLHLARQAARGGLEHATAVVRSEFMTSAGPTNPHQAWSRTFQPIAKPANARGKGDIPITDDNVPSDDFLWYPLMHGWNEGFARAGKGGGRDSDITNPWTSYCDAGLTMSPGWARWYEPGWSHRDPSNPIPFTATTYATSPDIQDPLYLDAEWRILRPSGSESWLDVRKKARYRLRYAVAMSDLTGLLLPHIQGPHIDEGTTQAASWIGRPWALDELDNDPDLVSTMPWRASMYAPAFHSMGVATSMAQGVYDLGLARYFAGRGGANSAVRLAAWTQQAPYLFGGWNAASRKPLDLAKVSLNHPISGAAQMDSAPPLTQSGMSPALSWLALKGHFESWDQVQSQFLYTPFGRAGDPAASPSAYHYSPSGNPWQVNLLTAPPAVIRAMIFGYLPGEAKVYNGTLLKETWTSWDKERNVDSYGGGSSTPNTHAYFSWDRRTMAWIFAGGQQQWKDAAGDPWSTTSAGPDPYPGDPDNLPAGWRMDVGAFCTVNRLGDGTSALGTIDAKLTVLDNWGAGNRKSSPQDPLTTAGYLREMHFPIVLLQEWKHNGQDFDANGDGKFERWTLQPPGEALCALTREGGYVHFDSYFLDIAQALLHTVAVVRSSWQDINNDGVIDGAKEISAATNNETGKVYMPADFDTLAEIDRAFVEAMGEGFTTRRGAPGTGLYQRLGSDWGGAGGEQRYFGQVVAVDLAALSSPSKTISGSLLSGDEQNLLELVLNDARMSFFGANPQYASSFRPKDFSGDGNVYCSCYRDPSTASSATAKAAWRSWRSAASGGYDGQAPNPVRLRSVTGSFVLHKSRYWRILTRGQVWDERFKRVVSEANLESVYALDPDGKIFDKDGNALGGSDLEAGILFQKWLHNPNRYGRPVLYP